MRNIAKFTVGVAIALAITGTAAPQKAEAKAYAAKTVKTVDGQAAYIQTNRIIKNIKITSSDKKFNYKKTGPDMIKVTNTDMGKTQTIKVTYKNKNTQEFTIKTITNYKTKVVNELKGLLKDPDLGMKKAAEMYNKKKGSTNMEVVIHRESDDDAKNYTVNEAVTEFTTSQKKAFILEMYFRTKMSYGTFIHFENDLEVNAQYQKLYNGKFKGVCCNGAGIGEETCKKLNIESKYVLSDEMDHAWLVVKAVDTNGTSYWHGVFATSFAVSLKNSVKSNTKGTNYISLTKKAATETYAYPVEYTVKLSRKGAPPSKKPTVVVPTEPTKPCPCPGCYGKLSHTDPTNAYITSKKVNAVIKNKVYTLYVHNGGGVIRVYDASGNEYPNFAILYPEYLE